MSPRTILKILFAFAALSASVTPAPASAAPATLRVSPTSIDQRVSAGTLLPAVTLRNDGDRSVVIDAFALRAGQELNGLPRWTIDRRSQRIGQSFVRVSPARFRLAPGESRNVRGRVLAPRPARGNGAYGVLIFNARLAGRSGRGDAVVGANVRLATNLLLRYPGRVRHDTVLEGVRAEQAGPGVVRFFARMRNRGDLHMEPSVRIKVRDSSGQVVVRGRFVSGNVLPLASRELTVDRHKILPAGRYMARVIARAGRRTTTKLMAFRLVGPNELPTAKLQIEQLRPPQPDVDEDFDATVVLVNRGTAPARPRGFMTVSSMDGRPLARRPLRLGVLGPNQRVAFSASFPELGEGQYRLSASVAAPGGADERTVIFAPGERVSRFDRLLDWAAAHVALLIAVFAASMLMTILAAGAYISRLRRSAAAAAR